MNDNNLTISRRGMLLAASAFAVLTAAPSFAQESEQPVVLITGTSSGFGRLMAETFARNKLRVIATMRGIAGRNAMAAQELRALNIDVIEIDVTDQASVDRGVAEALQLTGRIDILVNNAGVVVPGPAALQPVSAFDANIETNSIGALRMFRAVAPQMRERKRGYLVQFSSALGRILDPMLGGYCASKLAAEAAADALAYEEAMFGIEVTIVQPAGAYPTQLQANALRYFDEMAASLPDSEKPLLAAFAKHIDHMRKGLVPDQTLDPQEIANAMLSLIAMDHGNRPRRLAPGPFKDVVDSLNQAHEAVNPAELARRDGSRARCIVAAHQRASANTSTDAVLRRRRSADDRRNRRPLLYAAHSEKNELPAGRGRRCLDIDRLHRHARVQAHRQRDDRPVARRCRGRIRQ